MVTVRVTHRMNLGAINVIVRSPGGAVGRDMYRRGKRVESRAKHLVHVDTGRLRSSITTTLVSRSGYPVARVGSRVSYAYWHHEGHGVIVPRRGRFLVFEVGGQVVFTRRVRAVPGNPYLRNALTAARG